MMRPFRFRPNLVLLAALLATACADSGAGPDGGQLDIVAPALIDSIGTRLVVTASIGSLTTTLPDLTIVEETRWLHERPVFQRLGPGTLIAQSAGRVRIEVRAFNETRSIDVVVTPRRPAIITQITSGDTITLRGYAMNRIGRDSIEGPTVTQVVKQDSAQLTFRFVPAVAQTCSPSIEVPLFVHGVTAHTPLGVSGPHPDALALQIGESAALPDGNICLRLRAASNATYHLAYFDARGLELSRTRSLSGYQEPSFIIRAQDHRSGGFGRAPHTQWSKPAAAPTHEHVSTTTVQPALLAPLAVGDTFRHYTYWGVYHLTVVRVYENAFVWSVRTSDLVRLTPAIRQYADSAFAFLAGPVASFYDSIYSPDRPHSGNGQYLINSPIFRVDSASAVLGAASQGSFAVWMQADMTAGVKPDGLMSVVAHEYAHSRDLYYQQQSGAPVHETWALEGLATFLSAETMRRRANLGFDANVLWADKPLADQLFGLFAEAHRFQGFIGRGYENTSPLLRDFTMRLMSKGLSYRQAVREVATSAAFGWFGCTSAGECASTGLAERMQQLMGPEWDPSEAVLKFTLSQTADDLIANSEFRNPTFFRYGQSARELGSFGPWVFTSYRGVSTHGKLPHLVDYFVIEGSDAGAFSFWDTPPGFKWMLLRVR